jgi:hypothetical protein
MNLFKGLVQQQNKAALAQLNDGDAKKEWEPKRKRWFELKRTHQPHRACPDAKERKTPRSVFRGKKMVIQPRFALAKAPMCRKSGCGDGCDCTD